VPSSNFGNYLQTYFKRRACQLIGQTKDFDHVGQLLLAGTNQNNFNMLLGEISILTFIYLAREI